ncbi:hypothetical protein ACTQ5X_06775 [Jeotgalibaca porci]|uniref:hypothetical protein n=1 Tax=Jeotgalibaca porci TaxID=1868793 RepID=UPI003F90CBA3
MKSSAFRNLDFIFYENKPNDGEEYIQILGREKNRRVIKYIKKVYIRDVEALNTYNVVIAKANGSGNFGEILSAPVIAKPGLGTTETFISIGAFKTKLEAINLEKYIYTKFCRAMLGILKVTQDNLSGKWERVPLQDFTEASDINWSKSINEIDQQLFKKYNLNEEEIQFRECKIFCVNRKKEVPSVE